MTVLPESSGTDYPADSGWTRRFAASLARLHEAADLYRQLGFDVFIGPATPDPDASCGACLAGASAADGTLYTRPRPIQENNASDKQTT
jgi:hypothetical protein